MLCWITSLVDAKSYIVLTINDWLFTLKNLFNTFFSIFGSQLPDYKSEFADHFAQVLIPRNMTEHAQKKIMFCFACEIKKKFISLAN